MVTEWFRQKSWDEKIEQDFFTRLSRSRSQRDQYLVIQALTIAETFPVAALRLVDFYFETKKGNFDDVRALRAKVEAYLNLSQIDLAIEVMKSILAIERMQPNYKTTTYVDYPFLIATQRISSEYRDALDILKEREGDLVFPLDKFKWHAAKSLIHHVFGHIADSKKHAAFALEATKEKKSGFRYHQNLGLVGTDYKDVIVTLRQIFA